MNLMRWWLVGSLPFAALSTVAAQPRGQNPNLGEAYRIELEVRRWDPELVSELRLSAAGLSGSTLDPVDALELPEERGFDFHLGIRATRRLKLRGSWVRFDYQGEATAERDLAIAGLFAPAGSSVDSSLEIEHLRLGAEFDIFHGLYGFLAVVGEYARFESRSSFAVNREEASPEPLRIELPIFGLKGRVYLTPALSLTAEATGMKREAEGVMTEVDAAATYNMLPNLAVSYGYRNSYNRVKSVEPSGDRAVFRLRGQYFSVTVRF